jgi:hypothetical protein
MCKTCPLVMSASAFFARKIGSGQLKPRASRSFWNSIHFASTILFKCRSAFRPTPSFKPQQLHWCWCRPKGRPTRAHTSPTNSISINKFCRSAFRPTRSFKPQQLHWCWRRPKGRPTRAHASPTNSISINKFCRSAFRPTRSFKLQQLHWCWCRPAMRHAASPTVQPEHSLRFKPVT